MRWIGIDITNKNLWVIFEINGESVYITETMVSTWIVSAVLICFALFVRRKLKTWKDIPTGFQSLIESAVDAITNLVKNAMGDKLQILGGYFFAVFAFILVSNYTGLVGLRPPTSSLATTIALGLGTFVFIHIAGIRYQKLNYLKGYLKPVFIFLPMNIIAEMSRPISLGFRLFGNVFGGLILATIVYSMLPTILTFAVPGIVHLWFDLFVGALQAFVFTMLSLTFISLKSE